MLNNNVFIHQRAYTARMKIEMAIKIYSIHSNDEGLETFEIRCILKTNRCICSISNIPQLLEGKFLQENVFRREDDLGIPGIRYIEIFDTREMRQTF